MIEPLESRTLFSTAVDTSSVGLYAPDATATVLQTNKPLWIVIHGMDSDKSDPGLQALAQAVQAQVPQDQTLILNWGALATAQAAPDGVTAYRNAWAAADKIAMMLRRSRIPASRVNLIGFSMGGQLEDRIAKDLKSSTTEVNRIIAIDPSAQGYAVNNRGHLSRHIPDFAGNSSYSIAFWGKDGDSFYAAPTSADATVLLTGLTGSQVQQHVETAYLFGNMMSRDAGLQATGGENISSLFSIANITSGNLPAWKTNAYAPGYEATMNCNFSNPSSFSSIQPVLLTFINHRGHQQQIQ
jgi:hypothetical protein